MEPLIECVPNFSEGRDQTVIDTITQSIVAVEGITLLDVDPGQDTNRTVVTFVGNPQAVEEAAYQAIKTASTVIDMRHHNGAHPRMGATDVCPFIPVRDATVDDCVEISKRVGERVGKELRIPVYLYEHSAQTPERENLARIREGEYEGLADKLNDLHWKPDFGPAEFNARAGATVIGCREFLIAYNIDLNTRDARLATDIAFELREKGRSRRIPHPTSKNLLDGEIMRYQDNHFPCSICDETFSDKESLIQHTKTEHDYDIVALWEEFGYDPDNMIGKPVKTPGHFQNVKAIGWYIDTYHRAQISINFTNYKVSTIHDVFDKVCELATERGIRVTGSELVGLIPLEAILMAGQHYLKAQKRSVGIPQKDIIEAAVQSLGLNDVSPFDPYEKIIDLAVEKGQSAPLMSMTTQAFVTETSTNSPAPGGGSVSALAGSMGAALVSMVAALTHEKKGYFDTKPVMDEVGEKAQAILGRLNVLVDEDTRAFNRVMDANRLPGGTPEEKKEKETAVLAANKYATEVPFEVATLSLEMMKLAENMVQEGNPNSVSDAGVAGAVGLAAVRGAGLNVLINLGGIEGDDRFVKKMREDTYDLFDQADTLQQKIFKQTQKVIEGDD